MLEHGKTSDEAKEALNFQITVAIAWIAVSVATTILTVITFGLGALLNVLLFAIWVAAALFSVMGFVSSKDGKAYKYPFALRLIK